MNAGVVDRALVEALEIDAEMEDCVAKLPVICASAAACAAPNVPAPALWGECSVDMGKGGNAPVGGGEGAEADSCRDRVLPLDRVDSRDAGLSVRVLEPDPSDIGAEACGLSDVDPREPGRPLTDRAD